MALPETSPRNAYGDYASVKLRLAKLGSLCRNGGMNGEIKLSLVLTEHIPWDKALPLLNKLGRGSILLVNQGKLTPQKGGLAKLQVDVEIVDLSFCSDGIMGIGKGLRLESKHLDCISTDSCKVSIQTTNPNAEEIRRLNKQLQDIAYGRAKGTNACDAVTAIRQRIKELGGNPVHIHPH